MQYIEPVPDGRSQASSRLMLILRHDQKHNANLEWLVRRYARSHDFGRWLFSAVICKGLASSVAAGGMQAVGSVAAIVGAAANADKVWAIPSDSWANFGLLRRATREIAKVRAFNVDNKRKLAMIASAGAGSIPAVLGLYFALFVIRFMLAGG